MSPGLELRTGSEAAILSFLSKSSKLCDLPWNSVSPFVNERDPTPMTLPYLQGWGGGCRLR